MHFIYNQPKCASGLVKQHRNKMDVKGPYQEGQKSRVCVVSFSEWAQFFLNESENLHT